MKLAAFPAPLNTTGGEHMKIKHFALFFIIIPLLASCAGRHEKYRAHYFDLFDTYATVTGYAESKEEFDRFSEAAYNRLHELHRYFDIYSEYDGINNLKTVNDMAGIAPVEVCDEIIDLLVFAKHAYVESEGTLNVALGPVLSIWHEYRENGLENPEAAELPPYGLLASAIELADIGKLTVDEVNGTVFLEEKGMSLDVGAIAKGFAVQLAVDGLKSMGAEPFLLDVGGNIAAVGKPPDGRDSWSVGIRDPFEADGGDGILETVRIDGASVVTSGDYQRYYTVNGIRYSHIIDPETLMPAALYRSVTVIYGDSGVADMLSTALFILPYENGRAIAEKRGAAVVWVFADGTVISSQTP